MKRSRPRDGHPQHHPASKPVRFVAFNTTEGWSRYITEDIGREIVERR
jgi:hypothetical protein